MFSSFIDDIVFHTDEDSGSMALNVTRGNMSISVLEETLYPDLEGTVRVGDLSSLLEPYVREYGRVGLSCTFDDDDTAAVVDGVTIIYGRADVGGTATAFTEGHFLTVLNGPKQTAYGSEERLYAYGTDSQSVTVNAEVRMPDGTYDTLTATIAATGTVDGVSQFDVSVLKIVDAISLVGGRLLRYTVSAGSREQVFEVVERLTPADPSLVFVNSFGCEEFLHCYGTLKREGKYTRSSARIRGMLRNFRIEEERLFTANTGWMNDDMADWAEELFRSDEVWLWEDKQRGHEVVVSDSKSEVNNEDDFMVAYEFSYTYAQKVQNVMRKRKAVRIHSEQFEDIYN